MRPVSACSRPFPLCPVLGCFPLRWRPGGGEGDRQWSWRGEAPSGGGRAGWALGPRATPAYLLSRGGGVRLAPACPALPGGEVRGCRRQPVPRCLRRDLGGKHPPWGGEPGLAAAAGQPESLAEPTAPSAGSVSPALFPQRGRLCGRLMG